MKPINTIDRKIPGRNRRSQTGHAFLEMALYAPMLFFLFAGTLDWGFYSYALITTQNAARVAAEYTSGGPTTASDSANACTIVLDVMRKLPNVGTSTTSCGSGVVGVNAISTTGSDGSAASQVSVTYRSLTMIPIPGILTNQLNVTRSVKMRLRS